MVSLEFEDVLINEKDGSVKLKLRKSKTDPHGIGKNLYLSSEAQNILKEWINRSKISSGKLFRSVTSAGKIKDGIHVIWPHLVIPHSFQHLIRKQILAIASEMKCLHNICKQIIQFPAGHILTYSLDTSEYTQQRYYDNEYKYEMKSRRNKYNTYPTTMLATNKIADKKEVLELSTTWTTNQENLFKKALKQGGEITINKVHFKVIAQEAILNSKGEKDPGVIQVPGADLRF